VPPQPTLTDGVVTLRPWTHADIDEAIAGHDEEIRYWFGFPMVTPSHAIQKQAIDSWHESYADGRRRVNFLVEVDGAIAGNVEVQDRGSGTGSLSWALYAGRRGQGSATRAVRLLVDYAFEELGYQRVEAEVDPRNVKSLRVASRAGLRREGVRRVAPGMVDVDDGTGVVVLGRLASDPPVTEPEGFRSVLNSALPRKRGISQLLVRDSDGRVLMCQLTYKRDWDLPGGVVEVGESPQLASGREIEEELALTIEPGRLLLTDWLPPWGGWDDAICLVFDGGVHDPSILDTMVTEPREIRTAEFCTPEQVAERAADFTARRVAAALRAAERGTTDYTESGRG
jgi:RimJ/RimL family protein N-acetyltransferase/ADP-ribose pyrophosphatase YjhB (NUDIX family)